MIYSLWPRVFFFSIIEEVTKRTTILYTFFLYYILCELLFFVKSSLGFIFYIIWGGLRLQLMISIFIFSSEVMIDFAYQIQQKCCVNLLTKRITLTRKISSRRTFEPTEELIGWANGTKGDHQLSGFLLYVTSFLSVQSFFALISNKI